MLMPKRVKYRRVQRGRMKGKATRGNVVTYGEFGPRPRALLDNLQSDRGRPYRHDPLHQARRPGLDKDIPPTSRSPRSPLRPAWVPVRAPLSTGWRW